MAVYYKFKSAKDYDSISIDGRFISVAILKERIFESKQLGRGTDFDLVVTNAQTDEEYIDEAMLVPKNTSVLVRRVPGRPRMPIVTGQVIEHDKPKVENNMSNVSQPTNSRFLGVDSSAMGLPEDSEWDEFGNDLYAIPEVLPVQGNPILYAPQSSKADEDSKIRAFIDTPALDLQCQTSSHRQGLRTGYEQKNDGRSWICRDGLERKTPPQGYVCHRCKMPGHFIQHCHTNGDPNFDIKRVQLPTGIPKSMLMATQDGSYALPSGGVATLMPNEDAFDREVEGLPSTRSRGDLPPELHCPLCKEVMKDAVLTSKCCFKSFCDKCIRDHVISKSVCACGATNILADDLLPNQTLRETINRGLESNNSSAENASSACKVQGMESRTSHPKMEPKIPSPTLSATSKGQPLPPPQTEEKSNVKEGNAVTAPQNTLHYKGRTEKVANGYGAMHDSMSAKELPSQGSALLFNGEVQQKPVSGEAGKKKKKKKAHLPLNATEIQWNIPQNIATENYLPFGATVCNPYWTGIQPGIDGYITHYGGSFPQMSYGLSPFGVPFDVLPQDPHGYIMPPVGPHRNLGNFGMCLNTGPPIMSTEEFEARKADLRRKPVVDSQGKSRELSKDQELRREVSSTGDVPPLKTECRPLPQRTADHRRRSESASVERLARDTEPSRPYTKRKSEYDSSRRESSHSDDYHRNNHEQHSHRYHRSESSSAAARSPWATVPPPHKSATTTASRHSKESVLTRNGFSGEDSAASKTRKQHFSSIGVSRTNAAAAVEYESSDDDDRNFKRRRTR